ncbi:MAG: DUF3120 domain-containing protein [Cyanobacteriota bacterium]|nr:DUF3120 domain-containing protein [Cyanobacteriota bacterium]
MRFSQTIAIFGATVFLISVPVFFQAPLVRQFPWLSLAMTGLWLFLSLKMLGNPSTRIWGDLLFGFSWSWLTGSIYWGWLRAEPLLHLPIEAIGVPFAIWCLCRNWGLIGNWFYLGSLFGTAVTDGYFYINGLIPYWRKIMVVEPEMALSIFQSAASRVLTPWGISWIVVLVGILLIVGILPLRSRELHWWAFGGAVLSTILVDSLFFLAACVA